MDVPIQSKRILVVEDNPEMRRTLVNTLKLEHYQVDQAEHGLAALAVLQRVTPDLILSDINMPRMDGIEFYRALRQNPRWVPIPFIFLTADDTPDEIRLSRTLGVEDYLTKPIEAADLVSAVNGRLLRVAQVEVAQSRQSLLETVKMLANTIELRDTHTHDHVARVAANARRLAETLGWAPEHLEMLEFGASLHDIGKIAISDTILNKPTPLTSDEWELMRQHPKWGAQILLEATYLRRALPYVLYHHERWDGSGYPHGLRGKDIPVEGRLLAIVDVYDALTHDRPYRPASDPYEVIQLLEKSSGRLFDPHLVKLFVALYAKGLLKP